MFLKRSLVYHCNNFKTDTGGLAACVGFFYVRELFFLKRKKIISNIIN